MFASSVILRTQQPLLIQRDETVNDTAAGLRILESLVSELEQAGFVAQRIRNVEIAFVEALLNAVRHGNQDDPRKNVRLNIASTARVCG